MAGTWRITTKRPTEEVWLVLPGAAAEAPHAATKVAKNLAEWRLEEWFPDALNTNRATLVQVCKALSGVTPPAATPTSALRAQVRLAFDAGKILAFAHDAKVQGKPKAAPPAPPPPKPQPVVTPVNPVLTPAKLVVVVKKFAANPAGGAPLPYTKPARHALHLKADAAFDGTGTFTCPGGKVKVFSAAKDGVEIKFDGTDNVFKPGASPAWAHKATLSGGVTVFIEGATASAALDDVTAKLELKGGSKPVGPPDTTTITSVEVTLDICKSRASAGAEPPVFSKDDKINKGRNLVVQDTAGHFERAQLVIQQVKPAAFKGTLVLSAKSGHVSAFEHEKPTKGEKKVDPFTITTDKVPAAGTKLWAEGVSASGEMRDTGFTLSLKGVEQDADHVRATAVALKLDLCKSRSKKAGDPPALSADDKVKVGRFIHEQAGGHHGRALLIVREILPKKFDGTVVLKGVALAAGKTELFPNERPTAGEAVIAVPHEIDYTKVKNEDQKFWVQGKTVSGALRDVSYFLHLKDDPPTNGDTVIVTVCKFTHLKADIPVTPEVTARAGNAPARHSHEITGAAADHWDFDDTKNKALVLVEDSILAAKPIKLSVQVAPAGVPVLWDAPRDLRPAKGDDPSIAKLSGQPAIHQDGVDPLKATLLADGVGTFNVSAFIDNNGNKKFDSQIDIEPYLVMNVVLVRVQGKKNTSRKGTKANLSPAAPTAATGCWVQSGGAAATAWVPANAGAYSRATVTLIGGGPQGRLGLDRVFAGWSQHIDATGTSASAPQGLDVFAQYRFQPPAPPPPPPPAPPLPAPPPQLHRQFWIFTRSGPMGSFFGPPPAAAPVVDASPILDVTPPPAPGTGGNSCTGQFGGNGPYTPLTKAGASPTVVDKAIGQEWTVDTLDSPSLGHGPAHGGGLPGTMIAFRCNIDFRVDLVFWTNLTAAPGPTGDPADRLYSSVQTNHWTVRFAINFNPVTGAPVGGVPAVGLKMTKDPSPTRRAIPVDGTGLETRAPAAISGIAVDATA